MRFPGRDLILKFSPLLIALFFLSLIVVSSPLYLSEEKKTPAADGGPQNVKTSTSVKESPADNSVKVNLDDSVKGTIDSTSSQTGTCTVTRNGVTEIVPADQVVVNESGSGDITVKVECNNSSSSTNGSSSNKTSIKNDIKVNVNSSN